MILKGFPNGVTWGQQYNIGEKPTVTLYTCINRHVGTPKQKKTSYVWGTRSSMLDWAIDAGLSCTKGVWYIYMIGILGSLSDVVGGFSCMYVYSSCNLLV